MVELRKPGAEATHIASADGAALQPSILPRQKTHSPGLKDFFDFLATSQQN